MMLLKALAPKSQKHMNSLVSPPTGVANVSPSHPAEKQQTYGHMNVFMNSLVLWSSQNCSINCCL